MNWLEREAKSEIRRFLFQHTEFKTPIRYLGLPGTEAAFEMAMPSIWPVEQCDLFECDPLKFPVVKETLSKLPAKYTLRGANIDDWINNLAIDHTDVYDLIWLDYCGPLSSIHLKTAANAAKILKSTGSLAFTFLCGREQGHIIDLLDVFGLEGPETSVNLPDEETPYHKRVRILLRTVMPILNPAKVTVIPYNDSSPMFLVLIQKTKIQGGELSMIRRSSLDWR